MGFFDSHQFSQLFLRKLLFFRAVLIMLPISSSFNSNSYSSLSVVLFFQSIGLLLGLMYSFSFLKYFSLTLLALSISLGFTLLVFFKIPCVARTNVSDLSSLSQKAKSLYWIPEYEVLNSQISPVNFLKNFESDCCSALLIF